MGRYKKLKKVAGENPARIKLELFEKGIKIDPTLKSEGSFREIIRTRGGLGSGIELILPDNIWVNAPVNEKFVVKSDLYLYRDKDSDDLWIRRGEEPIVNVAFAPQPEFYRLKTSSGVPTKMIGTLQGGYLAFFPTSSCEFWPMGLNCKFCSTGLNLGENEKRIKSVEEVVEVAKHAFDEKLASFIHVNIGFYPTPDRGIVKLAPYIKALRKETDAIIICQSTPPETNEWADYAYSIGVDSMSSNFEFYNPEYFKKYCPGKNKLIGQKRFFEWLEYLPEVFPSGAAAGEIIVGLEPIEDSIKAIDYMTSVGAHPIVCAFRPLLGTALEDLLPPPAEVMERVLIHAYQKCKENNIRMNAVDRVSIVMMAYEARRLIEGHRDPLFRKVIDGISATDWGKRLFKNLVLERKRKKFLSEYTMPESVRSIIQSQDPSLL